MALYIIPMTAAHFLLSLTNGSSDSISHSCTGKDSPSGHQKGRQKAKKTRQCKNCKEEKEACSPLEKENQKQPDRYHLPGWLGKMEEKNNKEEMHVFTFHPKKEKAADPASQPHKKTGSMDLFRLYKDLSIQMLMCYDEFTYQKKGVF